MNRIVNRIADNEGVSEEVVETVFQVLSRTQMMKSTAVSEAYHKLMDNTEINPSIGWSKVLKPLYVHANDDEKLRSWRVASGSGFKVFVKNYYNSILPPQYSIRMRNRADREQIIEELELPSKTSVRDLRMTIEVDYNNQDVLVGVMNVQTGLRDVFTNISSVSTELLNMGYFVPLLTLDTRGVLARDNRSPKRERIKKDRYFSNIYCYNTDVEPTSQEDYETNVKIMNLRKERDVFVKDLESYCLSIDSEKLSQRALGFSRF